MKISIIRPVALGFIALVAGLGGCHQSVAPTAAVRPVRVEVVRPRPLTAGDTYAGSVVARYESSLGFRVGGKILRRLVDVGDRVHAGQVLEILDQQDLRLAYQSAAAQVAARRADAELAAADLARDQRLVAQGYISRAALDAQRSSAEAARAALDAARARADQAANQLRYGALKSDHDGVVTAVLAEAGQVVSAGQPAIRVARTGELEVATSIPEDRVTALKIGMPVTVSLWSKPGRHLEARIRELSQSADPATRTYAARISILHPPGDLRLGMTAAVQIASGGTQDAIALPLPAVIERGGRAGVWRLNSKTSRVDFTPVRVSGVTGNRALIAAGLRAGDVVVTAGANFLAPGQKVRRLTAPDAGSMVD